MIFIIVTQLNSTVEIFSREHKTYVTQNRPCSSRRKIREKRREDALLATSNIARLVTKSTGNTTAPK